MTVIIRLARCGRKNQPFYHIVVANSRSPRDGKFIERLGFFNPTLKNDHKDKYRIDIDLCNKWLSNGSQMSKRVESLYKAHTKENS